ncbi:MAG: hypothetical protein C4314_01005 [Thermoflexus sp.]
MPRTSFPPRLGSSPLEAQRLQTLQLRQQAPQEDPLLVLALPDQAGEFLPQPPQPFLHRRHRLHGFPLPIRLAPILNGIPRAPGEGLVEIRLKNR